MVGEVGVGEGIRAVCCVVWFGLLCYCCRFNVTTVDSSFESLLVTKHVGSSSRFHFARFSVQLFQDHNFFSSLPRSRGLQIDHTVDNANLHSTGLTTYHPQEHHSPCHTTYPYRVTVADTN